VLRLFADYYDDPEDPEDLLDMVGLRAVAGTPWRRLSGGEQQRLSLALAVVGRPEVVFLDEPTAGVDPEGRIAVRGVITGLRDRGACVVLTTHELPEAERVADDVVIMAAGKAVARGTVAELAAAGGEGGIRFQAPAALDLATLGAALGADADTVTEDRPGEYRIAGEATPTRLAALAQWMDDRGLPLTELRAGRRSLEEIYLRVTGGEDERHSPEHRDDVRGAGGRG
jgi:ABC-2 type transport system ATP-binding protein